MYHSKYTTCLENVLRSKLGEEISPLELLEQGRKIIFNFDYTTPKDIDKEEFKKEFESMFLSKFMFDEFAFETYGAFYLKLFGKMLEIMPTYSQMINLVYSISNDDFYNINKSNSESIDENSAEHTSTNNEKNKSKSMSSDFPQNLINSYEIESVNYANNGTKNESENNSSNSSNDKATNKSTTTNKSISGNVFANLSNYNTELKNIFGMLLEEFQPLFIGLY